MSHNALHNSNLPHAFNTGAQASSFAFQQFIIEAVLGIVFNKIYEEKNRSVFGVFLLFFPLLRRVKTQPTREMFPRGACNLLILNI